MSKDKAEHERTEALARLDAYLATWSFFRGGVSVTSRGGSHVFLKDLRVLRAEVSDE